MRKNFSIFDNYGIEYKSRIIDLHNEFNITSITYLPFNRCLEFVWSRSEASERHPENFQRFTLKFEDVITFKVEGMLPKERNSNDTTLAYLGYLHPDDLELMEGCLMESESDETHHIVFGFENNLFIKIFADEVVLVE